MTQRATPKELRIFIATAMVLGLLFGTLQLSAAGYQVIERMEQVVDGQMATVEGRPTWKPGATIHVYIPTDPSGEGAEREAQAACKALEEKLRSETNANLTFEYHIGQPAPQVESPPPYVVELHWTDEESPAEPGSASPTTDVEPTGAPNEYRRTSEVKRGDITINRSQSAGQPYPLVSIYNIALHEFAHIFGLDHKTPDQDSVVMADRGADDPEKKHPVKDDDVRGLQDLYGRNSESKVPPEEPKDEDEAPAGTKCCAFECGGRFGCAMVDSQAECDRYNGVLADGVCEATSPEDKDLGVYGRCNGGLWSPCEPCGSDLGASHFEEPAEAGPPAEDDEDRISFSLLVRNDGAMLTQFAVRFVDSPWVDDVEIDVDGERFGPGSDPFDPPPATRCIPPGDEVAITYRATRSPDAPEGEIITTTVILDDVFASECYVFVFAAEEGDTDYTSLIPDDILACARTLAWTSGNRHRTHSDEQWSVKEYAPREMCAACGSPMCVVCMEYDLGTYDTRPGVTSAQRSCKRQVETYLRGTAREEREVLAAVYWLAYWDGRHNRNRP